MSQWLRVCTALPEDLGSVPSTHVRGLTTTSKDQKSPASVPHDPPQYLCSHVHTSQRVHIINIIKKTLKVNNKSCKIAI